MISPYRGFSALVSLAIISSFFFFFFNDTATTEIYTLSLHDALPISVDRTGPACRDRPGRSRAGTTRGPRSLPRAAAARQDRKSTRLNSSHGYISYAVFCLKKKKKQKSQIYPHCTQQAEASSTLASPP